MTQRVLKHPSLPHLLGLFIPKINQGYTNVERLLSLSQC